MSISITTLKEAISIKETIADLEARLEKILSSLHDQHSDPVVVEILKEGRRKMSKAARAKIAAAQRLRWSKVKGTVVAAEKAVVKLVKKTTKRFSAAHRAKLSAAAKARHAKAKGSAPAVAVAKPAKKA